ncbi:MAG: TolC family protein [Cytophagales bacterium]|nr:TolC family protein [Cytophagales bacterium]
MRLLFTVLCLCTYFGSLFGQVQQEDSRKEQIKTRLVELALKRVPALQIAKLDVKVLEKEQMITKVSWLSNVTLRANFNEYNLGIKEYDRDINFFTPPNYNVTFGLRLGELFEKPAENKIARNKAIAAKLKSDEVRSDIKVKVLSLYEDYLLAREILGIQTLMTDDFHLRFTVQENKYKNGEVTLNEYKAAFLEYNQSKMKKASAEANMQKAKIALETYVGISIDELENSL